MPVGDPRFPPGRATAVDAPAPRLRVGFVLLDQFTLAAFSGLIDAVRLAADHGGRSRQILASWTTMSADGQPRRSSCGIALTPNSALVGPGAFDYVAVCGGNDTANIADRAALSRYLREAATAGARLVGVCSGTFAIAQAGLVGDRRVCVHWNSLAGFREQFPAIDASVDGLFIDAGDLITCAGSTAAIDLGLYLIARHCGRERAQQVVRHMMLQEARPCTMPQAHFHGSLDGVADVRVRVAAQFIEQRLDTPLTVEVMARHVGISVRQLERAFRAALGVSPTQFHRTLRLEYGRWLLENSRRPITEIAFDCGFADAAHFSRQFRASYGRMPSEIRGSSRQARAQPAGLA